MLVLALDTTSRSGSAAVVRDGELLGEIVGDDSRTHAERLPGDLMRVLADGVGSASTPSICSPSRRDRARSPGLRVGIAAMQGLAMATNRKIVPVSALDALAVAGRDPMLTPAAPVAAWIDAQRGQVFASLYDAAGMRVVKDPSSLPPIQTLDAWEHALVRWQRCGSSATGPRDTRPSSANGSAPARESSRRPPLAGIVGRLAAAAPARAVLPHAVVPIYIRRPDVELARSRRAE